mmetsp:Transcript_1393/g.3120  ORF Transcript_1393/g.3120 Transcript_1393/m.3120 type:complete len:324 (+) Transcript_1393:1660-2631(+)
MLPKCARRSRRTRLRCAGWRDQPRLARPPPRAETRARVKAMGRARVMGRSPERKTWASPPRRLPTSSASSSSHPPWRCRRRGGSASSSTTPTAPSSSGSAWVFRFEGRYSGVLTNPRAGLGLRRRGTCIPKDAPPPPLPPPPLPGGRGATPSATAPTPLCACPLPRSASSSTTRAPCLPPKRPPPTSLPCRLHTRTFPGSSWTPWTRTERRLPGTPRSSVATTSPTATTCYGWRISRTLPRRSPPSSRPRARGSRKMRRVGSGNRNSGRGLAAAGRTATPQGPRRTAQDPSAKPSPRSPPPLRRTRHQRRPPPPPRLRMRRRG